MSYECRLVVVSGRSGSGKSTALHALEDEGFYCIDNLPASLLLDLVHKYAKKQHESIRLAVGIDARNVADELKDFAKNFAKIRDNSRVCSEIIFLDADRESLLKRFSMTRRLHPMSQSGVSLEEAITKEYALLKSISTLANLRIDTSQLSVHGLRCLIRERIAGRSLGKINLLFQSFGFKYGVPADADFVFDVRCLPNPYWVESLREYSGTDQQVIDYLRGHKEVEDMQQDIFSFVHKWIPYFQDSTRSYITVAIGCTGGKHRSVFLCEALSKMVDSQALQVMVRHREQVK